MTKYDDEFIDFPKIARLSREIIVTEKIDGTNMQIYIPPEGDRLRAGSRNGWVTPEDDRAHGFMGWCEEHKKDLLTLGPGRHHGEWWGHNIQRGYGLKEKRFSLFNTARWSEKRPSCCSVVPVLYQGLFTTDAVEACIEKLRKEGSQAAPGFMRPEGVIIYHVLGNVGFKKTLLRDEEHKYEAKNREAKVK